MAIFLNLVQSISKGDDVYLFLVAVSRHFHLDHCGALPYMSEMVGFDGPIYMTHPTKAICPILLVSEDMVEAFCEVFTTSGINTRAYK